MKREYRDLIKSIEADGWYMVNGKGNGSSHLQFKHPIKKGKVTIPVSKGSLTKNIELSVLRQAGFRSKDETTK